MKKIFAFLLMTFFLASFSFASGVEGKWTTTIETDNGPFTFFADFVVKGEIITGTLSSDMGSVEISEGKIAGDEFEYVFEMEYNKIKHKGKLKDGKLLIKTSGDYGEMEFEMTRVKKE